MVRATTSVVKLVAAQRRWEALAEETAAAMASAMTGMVEAIREDGDGSRRAVAAERRADFLFHKGEAIAAKLTRIEAMIAAAIAPRRAVAIAA